MMSLTSPVSTDLDAVERRLRRDDHHRSGGAGCVELLDHVVHRRVGQHVGVVGQEVLVAVEVASHPAKALADRRFESGVDEGDRPVADVGMHQFDLAAAHDEIVRRGFLIGQEVVLDVRRAVAEAQNEFLVAEVGVVAHHVPDERSRTDHLHRLRHAVIAAVAHSHPVTAAE